MGNALKIGVPVLALAILAARMSAMDLHDTLDMRWFYSADEAAQYFSGLSPEKAERYFRHELLDMLFLTSYSVLFFFSLERMWPSVSWLGVIPGLFDFLETGGILLALKVGPQARIIACLGTATVLKWISAGLVMALLVSRLVWMKLRTRSINS